MPFASVANFRVLYGTFNGLYDGDVIVPLRIVEGLGAACLPSEVVVQRSRVLEDVYTLLISACCSACQATYLAV